MSAEDVLVRDEEAVRYVTFNRAAVKNALTMKVNERVIAAFEEASSKSSIRALVLTGAGGAFCSGLDLKTFMADGMDVKGLGPVLRTHFHGLIRAIAGCPKPVVAAVDGPAVGYGCDLALACDLRIASDRARFGEIFAKRGLMPDGGGTYLLPRLVGLGRALEMMLTGEMVEAAEAQRIGLVNRVVPFAELDAQVRTYAQALAKGPPLVHKAVKAAVYGALDGTLDQALDVEAEGQMKLLASKDFAEGLSAFMEKRPPRFEGE